MLTQDQKDLIIEDIEERVSPVFSLDVLNRVFYGSSPEEYTVMPHEVVHVKNGVLDTLNEDIPNLHYSSNVDTSGVDGEKADIRRFGDRYIYKGQINCVVSAEINPKLKELLLALYEAAYMEDVSQIFIILRQISIEKNNQVSRNMFDYTQRISHGRVKAMRL